MLQARVKTNDSTKEGRPTHWYVRTIIYLSSQDSDSRPLAASSVAGKKGIKQVQAYSASKAGVRALSQSIGQWTELF